MNTIHTQNIYMLYILTIFSSGVYTTLHTKSCFDLTQEERHTFRSWLNTPTPYQPTLERMRVATLIKEQKTNTPSFTMPELMQYTYQHKKIPSCTYINYHDPAHVIRVQSGITIKNAPLIVLFSRGYAKRVRPGSEDFIQSGGGVSSAYLLIRDNIIDDIPIITFDYPDEPAYFNFGQKTDLACLAYIYKQIRIYNKDARILLIGDCRGAKAALEFACGNPSNLAGLILFSPFFSAYKLTQQLTKHYLGNIPGGFFVLHNFFKTYFPHFNHHERNILELLPQLHNIPIFVGHRHNDTLVSNDDMYQFVAALKDTHHDNVTFFELYNNDVPHSRLTPHDTVQKAVKKFLHDHIY